jgi:hypothetical protein
MSNILIISKKSNFNDGIYLDLPPRQGTRKYTSPAATAIKGWPEEKKRGERELTGIRRA